MFESILIIIGETIGLNVTKYGYRNEYPQYYQSEQRWLEESDYRLIDQLYGIIIEASTNTFHCPTIDKIVRGETACKMHSDRPSTRQNYRTNSNVAFDVCLVSKITSAYGSGKPSTSIET